MYSEEERAKWKELVARWKAGEKVFDAGKRVEKTDATTVQRQEPVQPIKRQYGKVIDPKLVERKQQQQPVIKQGNTYKVKPRPQTFAGRVTQAVGGDWIKADMASAGVSQIPVVGQLNGALDFGYDLNNSAHNTLDVEANTNTAMSGIALLPFVRNGLKMLKGKTLPVKLRNFYDKVMTSSNSADDVNKALKIGRTADAIQDGASGQLDDIYKRFIQKYNNMQSNDQMLYPAFYGGLIGGLPGMYTMTTSDNIGEGTLGLVESIIGSGAGAGAGLRLAQTLNKKGLKKYYDLTLDGIKPKLSKNSITSDVLFNNKKASSLVSTRMKGLKSGDSYALIGDAELSTDSSPLYYLQLARHKNIGDIRPVLNSAGEVSYQKLNSYGHYHSIEDINRSIQTLNKTTGLNLPSTRQIGNTIYIPSVYITKK